MTDLKTRVIVGLGNPGQQYARTRHNLGFMVTDALARELGADSTRDRFKASIREIRVGDGRVVLAQPLTYMNLSGVSVQQIKNWYRIENDELLIVYDDADLPLGTIRLRESGSAGGHNGLQSILEQLGTKDVPRLRMGIGRSGGSTTGHVLSRFTADEESTVTDMIEKGVDASMLWIKHGPIVTMNRVNTVEPSVPKASSEGKAAQ